MKRLTAVFVLLLPLAADAAPSVSDGYRLVQQHQCEACHQNKVYGAAGMIYLRKDRKVTSWDKLKAQIAACNSMLGVGLFPDEEEHIAAFLNEAYYKFARP